MVYSDFTLAEVEARFGLQTDIQSDYFAHATPVTLTSRLRDAFDELAPLPHKFAVGGRVLNPK